MKQPTSGSELERRSAKALDAIRKAYGTEAGEYGSTRFVEHHLEELGEDEWLKLCGVARPEPNQVMDLLVLRTHPGEDEGIDTLDFSLPDSVSDYVLCVGFDGQHQGSQTNMRTDQKVRPGAYGFRRTSLIPLNALALLVNSTGGR